MWGGPSCFPRQLLILQPNLSDAALAHERLAKREHADTAHVYRTVACNLVRFLARECLKHIPRGATLQ